MGVIECSTPGCREAATTTFGIDDTPVCAACKTECDVALQAVMKDAEDRDTEIAKRRIE